MNNYISRYEDIINSENRNFDLCNTEECDNKYKICDLFCTFSLSELEEDDYIEGLNLSAEQNMLHINPLYNINTSDVKSIRSIPFSLIYNFNVEGYTRKYKLEDIFIRSPSKSVVNGKRYDMEACLVFSNKASYTVICTPIIASATDNKPDNIENEPLWELFMKITKEFPEKNQKVQIKSINYSPLIFVPVKGGNNRNFMTWTDETSSDRISYIQFYDENGALRCPQSFFKKFVNNLIGDMDTFEENINNQPERMNRNFKVFVNTNPAVEDGNQIITYKQIERPSLQKLATLEPSKKEKKCNGKKCKNYSGLIIFIILLILIIGLVIFLIRRSNLSMGPSHNTISPV